LVWQQGGSPEIMEYKNAEKWLKKLNDHGYAGYKDWRLPTLEEAMTLMEPQKNKDGLYLDPVFDKQQTWIWTCDPVTRASQRWVVDFGNGSCYGDYFISDFNFVRAVRFGQSSP